MAFPHRPGADRYPTGVLKVKGAILISIVVTSAAWHPDGSHRHDPDTISFTEACQATAHDLRRYLHRSEGLGSVVLRTCQRFRWFWSPFSPSVSPIPLTRSEPLSALAAVPASSATRMSTKGHGNHRRLQIQNGQGPVRRCDGDIHRCHLFGTSNTTTYVESAAGIGAGGRTGLTSVVVAICFAISAFLATFVSAVPLRGYRSRIGCSRYHDDVRPSKKFNGTTFDEAVPAFFAGIFMALCYSISYGIAAGFIFYCITKDLQKADKRYSSYSLDSYLAFHFELCAVGHCIRNLKRT